MLRLTDRKGFCKIVIGKCVKKFGVERNFVFQKIIHSL